MEKKIIAILKDLGIPMGNLGFKYIKDAITLTAENEDLMRSMTKPDGLYNLVAKKHHSTIQRVDLSIRHAVEYCSRHCDTDTIQKYFGNVGTTKLTNRNFIAALVYAVRE